MAKIIDMFTREVLYNEEPVLTERREVNLYIVKNEEQSESAPAEVSLNYEEQIKTVQKYIESYMERVRSLNYDPARNGR